MLLFTSIFGTAQDRSEVDLDTYLDTVETVFNIRFSYQTEAVQALKLPNSTFEQLDQTLQYIKKQTGLTITKIDDRYYSILPRTSSIFCAQILDAATLKPLEGATIQALNKNASAVTDANGFIKLALIKSGDSIKVSFLGYKTEVLKVEMLTSDCQQISLAPKSFTLDEVVIKRLFSRGIRKFPDDRIEINTREFDILPGLTDPDILQTLQILPGIESIDESINNINVRGGTQDENLMLWDEIKMYHTGHFFGLISAYNPNLTERVEVTKNANSSEYSGGVSSTIKMYTPNAITQKISGGAGFNGLSADAFLQIPISTKLALQISGRRSFADYFQTPTYTSYFNRSFQDSEIKNDGSSAENIKSLSDFRFHDYSAKILYDISPKHQLRASFISLNNTLEYAESDADEQFLNESLIDQDNIAFGINLSSVINPAYDTFLNAYYTQYNIRSTDQDFSNNQVLAQTNQVLETAFKAKGTWHLNSRMNFEHGYEFTETGIRNTTSVNQPVFQQRKKDVVRQHAIFGDWSLDTNNFRLRTGLRTTYFEKFNKIRLEPRINIRQKIGHFALKTEAALKNQSTTQIIDFEDNFLGVEKRRWVLVNDNDIPLITSKQISLGVDYTQNNWLINLTGFYKQVSGITASNQGFQNQFKFIKTNGSYEAKGLEFLVNKTTPKLSTWFTYTLATNVYSFKSLNPATFPNNTDIRHSINTGGSYALFNNFKIAVSLNYHTGRPYTLPIENAETLPSSSNTYVVNYDTPNAANLEDFMRFDATANYSFNWDAVTAKFTLGIINILNQTNTIQRYHEVNPDDNTQAIAIQNNSLGFTPNASLRLTF